MEFLLVVLDFLLWALKWILIIAAILFILAIIIDYIAFKYDSGLTTARITFKQFILLYDNVNPSKWQLLDMEHYLLYMPTGHNTQKIGFKTFYDYYRYQFWYWGRNKRIEKEKRLEKEHIFLEDAQKDLQATIEEREG
jgi:LPS O-antigen subunit length determinant protein (WzzB/FepE family)